MTIVDASLFIAAVIAKTMTINRKGAKHARKIFDVIIASVARRMVLILDDAELQWWS